MIRICAGKGGVRHDRKMKWRTALMFCILAFPVLLLSACDGKGMDSPSKITAYTKGNQGGVITSKLRSKQPVLLGDRLC